VKRRQKRKCLPKERRHLKKATDSAWWDVRPCRMTEWRSPVSGTLAQPLPTLSLLQFAYGSSPNGAAVSWSETANSQANSFRHIVVPFSQPDTTPRAINTRQTSKITKKSRRAFLKLDMLEIQATKQHYKQVQTRVHYTGYARDPGTHSKLPKSPDARSLNWICSISRRTSKITKKSRRAFLKLDMLEIQANKQNYQKVQTRVH